MCQRRSSAIHRSPRPDGIDSRGGIQRAARTRALSCSYAMSLNEQRVHRQQHSLQASRAQTRAVWTQVMMLKDAPTISQVLSAASHAPDACRKLLTHLQRLGKTGPDISKTINRNVPRRLRINRSDICRPRTAKTFPENADSETLNNENRHLKIRRRLREAER